MNFPTESEKPKREESRGGLVVDDSATVVGVSVVVVAAVVVVAEDVTQAAVVKASPRNRAKRATPDRPQYRNFLGNFATFPVGDRPLLSFTLRQTGTFVTRLYQMTVLKGCLDHSDD